MSERRRDAKRRPPAKPRPPAGGDARRRRTTTGEGSARGKRRGTATEARRGGLDEYRARRDFRVTPEPPPPSRARPSSDPNRDGGAADRAGRPPYMIHKHSATRLHYDLRLEMDGALASWAIPKGPSFDPSVKRLAVQTEDHPIEYGTFEGRIPDGEYGAGDSLIWDRGSYDTVPPGEGSEQRRRGHLHLEFHGEKLRGRFHLVRTRASEGNKPQWLFFKATDEHADPSLDIVERRPESVHSGRVAMRGPERAGVLRTLHPPPERLLEKVFPPMLATLVKEAPADPDRFWLELKYDGYRAIAALSGGKVAMWTRNQLDLVARFPEVARALSRIVVGEAVIDGEIAALDEAGRPRFQLLQRGRDEVLFAFDLLWLDGQDLRGRPLEERRDLLESLLSNQEAPLALSERIDEPVEEALARARRDGYEGLVAKRRGSRYEGRRSPDWLKLKVTNAQEVAVVGFTESDAATRQGAQMIAALLVGVMEKGELRYAGKVGTGYSEKQRRELGKALRAIEIERPAVAGAPRMRKAHWIQPGLVAQVEFSEWTEDGKLRHPSFQGIRADKTPEECVRERPSRVR